MRSRRRFRKPLLGVALALAGLALVVALVALLRGLGLADAAMATALAAGSVLVFAGILQRSADRTERWLGSATPATPGSRRPLALVAVGVLLLALGLVLRLLS